MTAHLDLLQSNIERLLPQQSVTRHLGELTLTVRAADLPSVMTQLRDAPDFRFELLIDLCGMDYLAYGSDISEGGAYFAAEDAPSKFPHRFAVVYHLLSTTHNWRLRVRAFAEDDALPMLDSVTGIWPNANWYEREAFDLYGIVFTGHNDLRRILTDYGFIGNPFRKDFPLSGNVEMHYDAEQRRIVYQPVSIDPREITPRIVREEQYGRH
ncbi:MAG: NADH-quinone oxidoreductase subunit C [Gallionellaceae bacterium]|jgi:NADH-quinone oxidoreductase subunit C|nr:NADH-quinone oxidoreductase subunit C [Gallionellaceae bacterium]